jgi:hypothetical protein
LHVVVGIAAAQDETAVAGRRAALDEAANVAVVGAFLVAIIKVGVSIAGPGGIAVPSEIGLGHRAAGRKDEARRGAGRERIGGTAWLDESASGGRAHRRAVDDGHSAGVSAAAIVVVNGCT